MNENGVKLKRENSEGMYMYVYGVVDIPAGTNKYI
jgi:hypothetical protein